MPSLRFGKIGAASGLLAATLTLSIAGASSAFAADPPPGQDEVIIDYDTCMIRGQGYVDSGGIQGFQCFPQPDGTAIFHWW